MPCLCPLFEAAGGGLAEAQLCKQASSLCPRSATLPPCDLGHVPKPP